MSDTSPAYPPPPPPSIPPPVYQGPAASPMPDYQPPPVAQPPVGYPQTWQQNPQQGIGAELALVGRAVELKQEIVETDLIAGIELAQSRGDERLAVRKLHSES